MKLYQYDDIKKLNQALGSFAKNGILVAKVKLLTVGDKIQYFVLADPKEVFPPKVESKTEDAAKESIKKEKPVKKSEGNAVVRGKADAVSEVSAKVEGKKEDEKVSGEKSVSTQKVG